ncbi:hypothetical protein [Streptomyces jumonjinensis]|uniref:hypothetical protein n=1 Tax=Streptomyces jumonjinensis TaxID=1945 RepID=UPI003795AF27
MIIEYKRTRDKEVVTQALSYLAWLNDSRAEFEGLVRDRLGAEAAGSVDWSGPGRIRVGSQVLKDAHRATWNPPGFD